MGKGKKRKRKVKPPRREEYTPGVAVHCSHCGRVLAELPENATGEEWAAFFHFLDRAECPRCGMGFRRKAGASELGSDQHTPPSGWGGLGRLLEFPRRFGL